MMWFDRKFYFGKSFKKKSIMQHNDVILSSKNYILPILTGETSTMANLSTKWGYFNAKYIIVRPPMECPTKTALDSVAKIFKSSAISGYDIVSVWSLNPWFLASYVTTVWPVSWAIRLERLDQLPELPNIPWAMIICPFCPPITSLCIWILLDNLQGKFRIVRKINILHTIWIFTPKFKPFSLSPTCTRSLTIFYSLYNSHFLDHSCTEKSQFCLQIHQYSTRKCMVKSVKQQFLIKIPKWKFNFRIVTVSFFFDFQDLKLYSRVDWPWQLRLVPFWLYNSRLLQAATAFLTLL